MHEQSRKLLFQPSAGTPDVAIAAKRAAGVSGTQLQSALTAPILGLAVPALCVAAFVAISTRPWFQNDDAYISYRYAAQLAAGHGLVFNPGEYVEGYTNLLWTLLIALFIKAGATAPRIAVVLSAVFASLTLIGSTVLCRSLLPKRLSLLAGLAPVLVLLTGAFTYWNVSGLEVPLFTALVTWACWAQIVQRVWLALALCILATLTRPDAVLLAACLLGWPALAGQQRGQTLRSRVILLRPLLLFASACAWLVAFRLYYYHDIVPNTFHAKVGQIAVSRGALYVASFLADGAGWLVPGAVMAAAMHRPLRPALCFALVYAAYVCSVGGDVYPFGRFLLPLVPILAAANITVLGSRSLPRAAKFSIPIAMGLTVLFSQAVPAPSWSLDMQRPWASPGSGFGVAKHPPVLLQKTGMVSDTFVRDHIAAFRKLVPGLHVIAAPGIGRLGYFAMDVRIIDILGLADRQVTRSEITIPYSVQLPGHTRTDAAYVLAQRPDIIDIGPFAGYCPPGSATPLIPGNSIVIGRVQIPAVMELWQNPELPRDYIYNTDARAWIRRDLLPKTAEIPCRSGATPAR